jgi:hypothetical protein
MCIFGKRREEKRVQNVCKKTGCANFVQTKLDPKSVQTCANLADFVRTWQMRETAFLWCTFCLYFRRAKCVIQSVLDSFTIAVDKKTV